MEVMTSLEYLLKEWTPLLKHSGALPRKAAATNSLELVIPIKRGDHTYGKHSRILMRSVIIW
jgi:hypothetical protein